MATQDTEKKLKEGKGNEDCILEDGIPHYEYTHVALKAVGDNPQPANLSKTKTFKDKKWFAGSFLESKNWEDDKWVQWVDILFAGRHQDFPPPDSKAQPKDYLLYVHNHLHKECKRKLVLAFREKVFNLGDKTPKWVHSLPALWLSK